jgi:hypothetical protein
MPLSCDCYPGCWGDHASNWLSVEIPRRLIEQAKLVNPIYPEHVAAVRLCQEAGVPYGSYVTDGCILSIETPQLVQAVIEVIRGNH